jgi:DNA invertase Pin-like site-specific DNA recombinase
MPDNNHTRKFVSYLRVSTTKQGRSGLGLEAQRHSVGQYLDGIAGAILLQELVEIESGKVDERPKLQEAMEHAKLTGAILLIAKLDRLSRNAHFLTGLAEKKLPFVACDMPNANEFTITIMAALAQQERKMISERTRAALQAVKARGKRLGNPKGAAHLRSFGNSAALAAIKQKADNRAGMLRKRLIDIRGNGHTTLTAMAVSRLLARISN